MGSTLFRHARVIDGTGAAPFAAEILVTNDRIAAIVRDGTMAPAPGADVVDCGGATLMPGLVEAHAHPSFCDTRSGAALGEIPPEEHTLLAAKFAARLLDAGFTSICSAAAAKPRLDVVIRNAINAGDIPGPRMLAASAEMTVTSGLGDVRMQHLHRDSFAIIADGADEFRRWARWFLREGVDTLKINPSGDEGAPAAHAHHTVMTEDEVAAVCEVARSRDKRVAAHARSAEAVKMAVRHGVQIVYHATLADEEALDLLESVKDRVFVAPTINITWASLYESEPFRPPPGTESRERLQAELESACRNVVELKKRGVRVLPGGDYGFAWTPIGTNARDIEHFVKLFGYSPMEAIVAATKLGGELMMRGNELGLVREGYLADLLLVDGDPSKDVSILQDRDRLLAIMKGGRFHKRPGPEPLVRRKAA